MLEKLLAAILGLTAAIQAQTEGGVATAATGKKTRAQAAVEGANATLAAQAATSTTTPVVQAAPGASLQDVAEVIKALAKVNRDGAVALLAKHGAPKASELKPESYAAVIAEGKALLTPPAAANPTDGLI